MLVVDASALLEVLLDTEAAPRINARISLAGESLHAPHLIDLECAQVLRRKVLASSISAAGGAAALTDLADFPLARYPHDFLLPRIWELRHSVSAYDAAYIALAEVLNAPLLTRDRALASAPARVRVEVL